MKLYINKISFFTQKKEDEKASDLIATNYAVVPETITVPDVSLIKNIEYENEPVVINRVKFDVVKNIVQYTTDEIAEMQKEKKQKELKLEYDGRTHKVETTLELATMTTLERLQLAFFALTNDRNKNTSYRKNGVQISVVYCFLDNDLVSKMNEIGLNTDPNFKITSLDEELSNL